MKLIGSEYVSGEPQQDLEANYTNTEWLALFNQLPNGVVVINTQGIISFCNEASKDLLQGDVTGEAWIDVIKTSFSPRDDDGHEISLKDGRRVNVAIRSLGGCLGELIVLTDITLSRAFEEQRARDRRLVEMGEMIAHLAHQIRTPLASAMLYANNLIHPNINEQKKQKCIDKIRQCHQSIEDQIRDLLFFAKGGKSLLEELPMSEFLNEIVKLLEAKIEEATVKFSLRNEIGDGSFISHKESLKGAIINLIDNAINANAKNIILSVVLNDKKFLVFSVVDDGDGMEEDVLSQSKRAFYTTRAKGTGLGLAVVDVVAKSHKGSLTSISKKGVGSTFVISIPFLKSKG